MTTTMRRLPRPTHRPERFIRLVHKEPPMRLHTALEIYELEGPKPRDAGAAGRATRVVHAHLTEGEIQELSLRWGKEPQGKGLFLAKLGEVRERLRRDGSL